MQGYQYRQLTRNNDMWRNCGWVVALGMVMSFGTIQTLRAGEPHSGTVVSGRLSQDASTYSRKRPLTVTIYRKRRIGGYSYRAADVVSTYGAAPAPYLDVRQSPGGPFDYGFFFDSAIKPHGGESPYHH